MCCAAKHNGQYNKNYSIHMNYFLVDLAEPEFLKILEFSRLFFMQSLQMLFKIKVYWKSDSQTKYNLTETLNTALKILRSIELL